MDKLNTTYNGGMPLLLNDLRFTDAAYREGFKAVLRAFRIDNKPFIISGCVATSLTSPDRLSITDGYIFMNDEIYQVNAHETLDGGGGFYRYKEVISYAIEGNKTFFDGTVNSTHEIRQATTEYVAGAPATLDLVPNENVFSEQRISHIAPMIFPRITTTERDITITGWVKGETIYNTTDNKLQCYDGTSWNDLW